MDITILTEQTSLARLVPFLSIMILMMIFEAVIPNVSRDFGRTGRWLTNLGFVVLGSFVMRFVFGAGAVGAAIWAESQGYGLLPLLGLDGQSPIIFVMVVLFFDATIYAQHVLFHHVPIFWRFHAVHHADPDLDATSGLRFHPVEFVLSMGIKVLLVIAIGAPAEAVILFEILLNATAIFSHANIRLPHGLDRVLRFVIVTPDMHRIHHVPSGHDVNTNFGFNLAIWDHLFGTYAKARFNHHITGLDGVDRQNATNLVKMLVLPFMSR